MPLWPAFQSPDCAKSTCVAIVSDEEISQAIGLLRKRIVFSALVVCGFFVFLEIALALLGVKASSESRDPYLGFSGQVPLFAESAVRALPSRV